MQCPQATADNRGSEYNGSIISAKDFSEYEIDNDLKTDNREDVKQLYKKVSNLKPSFLLIRRKDAKNLHYAV